MPNYDDSDRETTDALFRALADRTRRAMVERLARGPASVSDLAEPFGITLPTAMQHLEILEEAGITRSQKIGRVRTNQLIPDALGPVAAWATRQRTPAERRADRLVDHLADHP